MSTDATRPTPGPSPVTYVPGVIKKLWLWPALAFVLKVVGGVLDYNSNWSIVTMLVAFPLMYQLGRLLATKKLPGNAHLAHGNRIFFFMAILQAALMIASFNSSYVYIILLFALTVLFTCLYLWGADVNQRVQARKAAGES